MVEHPTSGCVEVVDAKEQPDSASVLVADGIDLSLAVGLSEEQPGLTTTQRFGRPSFAVAGESSTRSKPNASTKNRIASS
jgi:hypothetical protein